MHKTFVIAEAGLNHNGKLSIAKKLVNKAKEVGANAIKFQIYIAKDIVTKKAKKVSYQKKNDKNKTMLEMLKKNQLSFNDFKNLKKYCDKKKIEFISSAFDESSLKEILSKFVKGQKGSGKPKTKRPPSTYMKWLNENRQSIQEKYFDDYDGVETWEEDTVSQYYKDKGLGEPKKLKKPNMCILVSVKAGQLWKELGDDEKSKYSKPKANAEPKAKAKEKAEPKAAKSMPDPSEREPNSVKPGSEHGSQRPAAVKEKKSAEEDIGHRRWTLDWTIISLRSGRWLSNPLGPGTKRRQ